MENYTTAEKIEALKDNVKLQDEEKKKIVISNDAYAVSELLEILIRSINKNGR
jgi:hypothetical protein